MADAFKNGDLAGGLAGSLNALLPLIAAIVIQSGSEEGAPTGKANEATGSADLPAATPTSGGTEVTVPFLDENGQPIGQGDQGDLNESARDKMSRVVSMLKAKAYANPPLNIGLLAAPPGLALDVVPLSPIFTPFFDGIDPTGPSFHAYGRIDYVGSINDKGINSFEALVRNAVPGGTHTGELIPNGTISTVSVPFLGQIGDVVTIVDPNTKTIVNVTQDNHDFKYGFVQRGIVQLGDRLYVRTIRAGNNQTFIKSMMNQYGASLAFSGSTGSIMLDISGMRR